MEFSTHVDLLSRVANQDDQGAWWEFHERYKDLVVAFARRSGLQAIDCEDVAQQVFLNLCRSMEGFRYDPGKGKFRSYLKTAVLHEVFQHNRRVRQDLVLEGDAIEDRVAPDDHDPDALWEEEWRQFHIRKAMGKLASEFSEKDRMAFTEYALRNRPALETAEDLGLSVDQVYQAKSRILRRLSVLIGEQLEDLE